MKSPTQRCSELALLALLTLGLAASAAAGPREQAKRMHDRLVGIPPPAAVLDSMEASISGGDPVAAAYQAMANPVFYTSALKSFSTPWTNVAQSVYPPLNDYSATVIGIIRDDRPFTDVLTSDLVYVGAAGATSVGYSPTNNTHYEELERNRVDLSDPSLLIAMTQSGLPGSMLTPVDAAGVLTTRAAGEAFFSAGTNRRMLRFTAINFLCRDLEALNDVTRAADRVRQDVTRSPGGDSRVFHNTCVGCHSGMDPMAGAFAYFEWDATQERVIFTPGQVQPKYLINATTFQGGYATVDDRWDNFWRSGQNAILGWRAAAAGGYGPQSFGVEVASSRAFSVCQVEKVFKRLCLRPPGNPQDRAEVERVADVLEANSYRMKRAFAEVATYCMGS